MNYPVVDYQNSIKCAEACEGVTDQICQDLSCDYHKGISLETGSGAPDLSWEMAAVFRGSVRRARHDFGG